MSEYELEEVLPCGDWLVSKVNSKGKRSYWLKKEDAYWPVWNPSLIHRVALQAAILKEDGYKYLESTPQDKE